MSIVSTILITTTQYNRQWIEDEFLKIQINTLKSNNCLFILLTFLKIYYHYILPIRLVHVKLHNSITELNKMIIPIIFQIILSSYKI